MPRKYTPIRDLFTPSAGPRDNAWACVRCGWQLVENATRFARHITRCPEATREDRRVALEHLGGLNPEQLQAITFTAELARAFSLGGKAHIRTLFEDTQTTRAGEKAKLFRCKRCGHETTENATRFARHILSCENATEEDIAAAREHEALTKKRRYVRIAKQSADDGRAIRPPKGGQGWHPLDGGWVDCDEVPSAFTSLASSGLEQSSSSSYLPEVGSQGSELEALDPLEAALLTSVGSGELADILGGLGVMPKDEAVSAPQLSHGGDEENAASGHGPQPPSDQAATGLPQRISCSAALDCPMDRASGGGSSSPFSWPFETQEICTSGKPAAGIACPRPHEQHISSQAGDTSGTGHPAMPSLANREFVFPPGASVSTARMAAPSCDLSDLLEGLESLGDGQPYLPASPRPVPPAEVLYPVLLEAAAPTALAEEMEGRECGRWQSSATRTLFGAPAEAMQVATAHGENKRQRCREQGTSTTRVIVEAEEWVHFVRWRRTQQVPGSVPHTLGTAASLFQALHSYYLSHCQTCGSMYANCNSVYGPSGSTKLVARRIRSEWNKLLNVLRTILTCCAKQHLEAVLDKVRENPQRVQRLYSANIAISQEVVEMGHEAALSRRASVISLMTVDEFAAYWGLVKAFDHLSMAGDGETRDPNPESLQRLMATQQAAVKVGPGCMEFLLMSVGTRGCGSNGIIASDRGLLAAELEAIPSIDTEDLQYWSQVCSEFLPCLENLAVDEAAAVATSAWMYEVFSRVGWDLSLVM